MKKQERKQTTVAATVQGKKFALKSSEWDHKVHEVFTLGAAGVTLETDMAIAQQHALQLSGTSQAVGLVCVGPLPIFREQQRITCTLMETDPGGQVREKIVQAWLHNYGPVPVKHAEQFLTIHARTVTSMTVVLRARVKKACISKEFLRLAAHPREDNTRRGPQDAAGDPTRSQIGGCLEQTNDDCSWLQQVQEKQLMKWLRSDEWPIAYHPLGSKNDDFAVLWNKEDLKLEDLRSKYERARLCRSGINADRVRLQSGKSVPQCSTQNSRPRAG